MTRILVFRRALDRRVITNSEAGVRRSVESTNNRSKFMFDKRLGFSLT
jgi:hypothetical protein